MPKLTDTLTRMLAPQPHTPPPSEDYVPPALSAAGQAAPPALTSARNGNGKQQQATPTGHRTVAQRAPQPLQWQSNAWQFYRRCGEARQAVDWIAHGLSRFNLYIGKIDQDGSGDPEPVNDPGKAGEILTELCDGQIGQRGMLHRLGIHLLVPGESWLVGYPAPPPPGSRAARDGKQRDTGDRTTWSVLSRREWEDSDGGRVRLKLPEDPRAVAGDHWVTFEPSETVVVPIYLPDPEDATYATSAFESAMGPLEELDGLDRRVGADINSRLAGAGVLAIPESATMPTPQASDGANPINGDPFVTALTRAMSTAISDPNSASAVTPICVKVADESLAKMQHQTFATPFDAQVPPLREGTRERVAATLDVPKEVVTGIEDLNHWSAWVSTEDAVKTHIGPLAALICDNLTRKVLWPALRQEGVSDVENVCVWWDASEVVLRPDRSTEAMTAYKEGLISGRAARRELAFSEDDAPDTGEQQAPSGSDDEDQGDEQQPAAPVEQAPDGAPSGGQSEPGERPEPPNESDATQRAERDRETQPQT